MSLTLRQARPVRAQSSGSGGAPRRRYHLLPNGLPWLLPALVLSVGLIYYAVGYTGYISTLNWNGVSADREFVGLQNYAKLLHDPVFFKTLRHALLAFCVGLFAQVFLGLLVAVMLHSRVRLKTLYKVIIFLPALIAPAIMAPVHRQIFAQNGTLNWFLKRVGLGEYAQAWLANPTTSLWVIIAVQVWSSVGFAFILYYAGISQIDPETIEAARLDGVGNLRMIRLIIAPGVWPTTVSLAILHAINTLKTFDVPFLVTRGGPNYSSEFLGTYIYGQTVQLNHVGYAGALSVVLLVLAIVIGVAFSLVSRERR